MIQTIRAEERQYNDFDWLKTYWLFSFDNYYDESNVQFGSLRVFNDDIVQPKTGFDPHFHKEMEIVTIVVDGEVTHQDSAGNKAVIKAGDVQRMTAGKGILHSEHNLANKPVHFFQIWIYPDQRDLTPSYEQKSFQNIPKKNRLVPVASGQGFPNAIKIHAEATIYLGEIGKGRHIDFTNDEARGTFVYVTSGAVQVNGQAFKINDQARITKEPNVKLRAEEDSRLILIDVPFLE